MLVADPGELRHTTGLPALFSKKESD